MKFSQKLKRTDFALLLLAGALVLTGAIFLYSIGHKLGGEFTVYWKLHLLYAGAAGILALGVSLVDFRTWGQWSWLLYGAGLCLLILVLFIGTEINSATRWLSVPLIGEIQPSEFAKPATLVFVAWLSVYLRDNLSSHFLWLFPLAAGAVPTILTVLQPDLGTALVFIPAVLAIVFVGGISWRWIITGCLGLLLLAPIGYRFGMDSMQRQRIKTFLNISGTETGSGWTARQSMLAVGSGGLTGKGYMEGTQHVLGYLPRNVAPSDFIFPVIAEERGFLGAAGILSAFAGIIVCAIRTALLAPDRFGMALCTGIAVLLFTHVYINIGMTVLMSPVTGLPLPFISYGGSAIVSMMISVGLLQSVYIHR